MEVLWNDVSATDVEDPGWEMRGVNDGRAGRLVSLCDMRAEQGQRQHCSGRECVHAELSPISLHPVE
jgi:hypothetical protein